MSEQTEELHRAARCVYIAMDKPVADDLARILKAAADHIALLEKSNTTMKEAHEHILEYWNHDENEKAMSDALWHIIETSEAALRNAGEGV